MARYLEPINNLTQVDLFQTANMYADGLLGIGLLIAIFSLIFFTMRGYDPAKSFASASFVTGIVAIMFRVMNVVSDMVMWLCLVLMIIGIAVVYFSDRV